MEIHIPTITLILGFTHSMQVIVFYYLFKVNKSVKGPLWWLLWSAAAALGFILILLRRIPVFEPYSVIFQNIVIVAGVLFIYIGVVKFYEKRLNKIFIYIVFASFALSHIFFFLIIDSILARTLLFDIALLFIAIITAYKLYKHKYEAVQASVHFILVVFAFHIVFFLLRLIFVITNKQNINVFSPEFDNSIQYLDALLVSLFWTIGFIMLINQKLNAEILEAKNKFELIFNTGPDAVMISGLRDGIIETCNDNFCKITGYSKEHVKGKTSYELDIWVNKQERDRLMKILINNNYCENQNFLFRKSNGEILHGLLSANIIYLNKKPYILSVTRDISDLIKAQETIRNKNIELESLNHLKDRLFSVIGHDLNGPLTTILGFSEILQLKYAEMFGSEANEMLTKIIDSAYKTSQLLNDLLIWARTQTGQIDIVPSIININTLINKVINLYSLQINEKEITLVFKQKHDISIKSDSDILYTVLRNLLSNAIKYTNIGGKIEIGLFMRKKYVEFSISDNGVGMHSSVAASLFAMPYIQSQRGTMHEKGTGIGLSICKEFVEKLNGTIWVVSEEGKGTTFYFSIPTDIENFE
jgi:PAS domain S-box-containing protein